MLDHHLTPEQGQRREAFKAFADSAIAPRAEGFDESGHMPRDFVRELGSEGLLASFVPGAWAGSGLDMVSYGLLCEQLGRACSSVRNLVAVEDMVAYSISRWGTRAQKERWLRPIATGETLAAFALTEPDVGSDAGGIRMTASADGDEYVLEGEKQWISFGQTADLLLVFAQCDGAHTAFLVEAGAPGLTVEPIEGLLGLRGSMLASLRFEGCRVPASDMLGQPGMGLGFVASSALDVGRYSTAWGCVGLAQACLEEALRYSSEREQYGSAIKEFQLVQRMLADLITDTSAARLLCYDAGRAKDGSHPDAIARTLIAKYFASTMCNRAASDAVQIHGAQGVGAQSPVQRLFRDAKVMEIIEGTTQIQQTIIAECGDHTVH